jgi:hypothetical protein
MRIVRNLPEERRVQEPSSRMRCPSCHAKQSWTTVRFNSAFRCASCGESLHIPESYVTKGSVPSLILSVILTYMSGVGGYRLVIVPIMLFFVCAGIISTALRFLAPPELESLERQER